MGHLFLLLLILSKTLSIVIHREVGNIKIHYSNRSLFTKRKELNKKTRILNNRL